MNNVNYNRPGYMPNTTYNNNSFDHINQAFLNWIYNGNFNVQQQQAYVNAWNNMGPQWVANKRNSGISDYYISNYFPEFINMYGPQFMSQYFGDYNNPQQGRSFGSYAMPSPAYQQTQLQQQNMQMQQQMMNCTPTIGYNWNQQQQYMNNTGSRPMSSYAINAAPPQPMMNGGYGQPAGRSPTLDNSSFYSSGNNNNVITPRPASLIPTQPIGVPAKPDLAEVANRQRAMEEQHALQDAVLKKLYEAPKPDNSSIVSIDVDDLTANITEYHHDDGSVINYIDCDFKRPVKNEEEALADVLDLQQEDDTEVFCIINHKPMKVIDLDNEVVNKAITSMKDAIKEMPVKNRSQFYARLTRLRRILSDASDAGYNDLENLLVDTFNKYAEAAFSHSDMSVEDKKYEPISDFKDITLMLAPEKHRCKKVVDEEYTNVTQRVIVDVLIPMINTMEIIDYKKPENKQLIQRGYPKHVPMDGSSLDITKAFEEDAFVAALAANEMNDTPLGEYLFNHTLITYEAPPFIYTTLHDWDADLSSPLLFTGGTPESDFEFMLLKQYGMTKPFTLQIDTGSTIISKRGAASTDNWICLLP